MIPFLNNSSLTDKVARFYIYSIISNSLKINIFKHLVYIRIYTTLTPKIKGKGMQIYLISHTQVCNIKYIAHLSVRYKKYRTFILIKTFQSIIKFFDEIVINHQVYIGSSNHCDCGFELTCNF